MATKTATATTVSATSKISISQMVTTISRTTKRPDLRILSFNEFKAAVACYWLLSKGKAATHEEVMSVYQTGKAKGLWSCSKFDKDSGEDPVIFINIESAKPVIEELGVEV